MTTFLPGDIAACYGADWTSRLIRLGTASLFPPRGLCVGPSHVAILCRWREQMIWVESTTLCHWPCLLRGMRWAGVQAHHPGERIADYRNGGGRVALFRLRRFHQLSAKESTLLTQLLLKEFLEPGLRYDVGGALLSGTRVLQWTRFFPGADLEQLFCSELVAAIVMRLNRMNHANPSRFHPARLLRELVRTGKYELVTPCLSSQAQRGKESTDG